MLCLTCFISKRSIPENIKTPVVKTPQILALELVAAAQITKKSVVYLIRIILLVCAVPFATPRLLEWR
jgi:hypothetical protein